MLSFFFSSSGFHHQPLRVPLFTYTIMICSCTCTICKVSSEKALKQKKKIHSELWGFTVVENIYFFYTLCSIILGSPEEQVKTLFSLLCDLRTGGKKSWVEVPQSFFHLFSIFPWQNLIWESMINNVCTQFYKRFSPSSFHTWKVLFFPLGFNTWMFFCVCM